MSDLCKEVTKDLIEFIEKSPDCYHTVENIKKELQLNGYTELFENEKWNVKNGGKYYVIRNLSSIIAFDVPNQEYQGIMVSSSHSDSPTYKIKQNPEISDEFYTRINVEGYGGMIASTWTDRPLSVSGRVVVKTENGIKTKLVNVDKDLIVIPNMAIHLNRKVNDGYAYNPAKDMIPLFSGKKPAKKFTEIISENSNVDFKDILGYDLFLYNRTKGTIWGCDDEFFSSPRIDDVQCAYMTLKGFLKSKKTNALKLYCVFDNEEVGSGTKQGAKSTFFTDVLIRVNNSLGFDFEKLNIEISSGFMISADNGHAVHPNLQEFSDKTNKPIMNNGIIIKYNANQKYTTDAISDAMFRKICNTADIPYQTYSNRSDIAGGSTLGNLLNEKLSINTIDIGTAQLAMHSAYETAGVKDNYYLLEAMKAFFSTEIKVRGVGEYEISVLG